MTFKNQPAFEVRAPDPVFWPKPDLHPWGELLKCNLENIFTENQKRVHELMNIFKIDFTFHIRIFTTYMKNGC